MSSRTGGELGPTAWDVVNAMASPLRSTASSSELGHEGNLIFMTVASILGRRSLRSMLERRSVSSLVEPGPSPEQLTQILEVAMTVPDHGGLRPWRLVVVSGAGRGRFGDALAEAAREADAGVDPAVAERIRSKAFVAPTLIAIAARLESGVKIPEWEQVASASCCGYAIALAADALGFGAMWKSSPFHRGTALFELLDLRPNAVFLGWVNLGTAAEAPPIRRAADLAPVVRWVSDGGPGAR